MENEKEISATLRRQQVLKNNVPECQTEYTFRDNISSL